MTENWLARWVNGRIGWHEADGNEGLKLHWPIDAGRVLVPLCGKSADIKWLARRGHEVVGVELSELAIRQFFSEQNLTFCFTPGEFLNCYKCSELPIILYCGDFLDFTDGYFDALYDRAALVALEPNIRPYYADHVTGLLKPGASKFVVTLEYDQNIAPGPPYSVMPDELIRYWDDLKQIEKKNDIDNCPPKFRAAGLTEISEVFWTSHL